jgi:hypothetical protein
MDTKSEEKRMYGAYGGVKTVRKVMQNAPRGNCLFFTHDIEYHIILVVFTLFKRLKCLLEICKKFPVVLVKFVREVFPKKSSIT